jgi:uncharacterized protein (TIGR00251 family)
VTEAAIRVEGGDLLLSVKARPCARADRIRGVKGGLLQVDVAAAAEDGKATERLLGFLAMELGVARRNVELVSGGFARFKRVRVRGISEVPEGLLAHQIQNR